MHSPEGGLAGALAIAVGASAAGRTHLALGRETARLVHGLTEVGLRDVGVGALLAGLLADAVSYELAFAVTGLTAVVALLSWLRAPETHLAATREGRRATGSGQLGEGPEVPNAGRASD